MKRLPYTPNSQIPSEYDEQCAVIRWARMMADTGQEPRLALLHGDSSGIRVSIGAAVKMKRAGRVRGWPDLQLPISSLKYKSNSLFIEMKRVKDGVVSTEQAEIINLLGGHHNHVVVCKGADEAIAVIKQYLGIK